ncbi:hypothetical protein G9A89_023378 [Geosiphon pyriformis]|nr:hypothetical protein G9A89_023378 [Geosiphon pyriformis]
MTTVKPLPYNVILKPSRHLLNPKFEGYKLTLFDDARTLCEILPEPGVNIPKVPVNAKLSYEELRSRVHFNHLFAGFDTPEGKGAAFFFNSEFNLIHVEYDLIKHSIHTEPLVQIPKPSTNSLDHIFIDPSVSNRVNYPSLRALSPTLLLATDGAGKIYLIRVFKDPQSQKFTGEIIQQANFYQNPELNDVTVTSTNCLSTSPCDLLDAKIIGDGQQARVHFIVYSTVHAKSGKKLQEAGGIFFDIFLLQISLNISSGIQLIHHLRGPDIPLYCSLDVNGKDYVIGSNSDYQLLPFGDHHLPSAIIETELKGSTNERIDHSENMIAPYMWTQTTNEVTIFFQLPQETPKSAVHCNLTNTHLSLTINPPSNSTTDLNGGSADDLIIKSRQPPAPCYVFTPFFDSIKISSSLWTIESKIGLLTIHLEKQKPGTCWTHVFKQDDGVLETVDPNEMTEFRERLEKFTSGSSSPGSFASLQHTIGHEIEAEIDSEGRSINFFWIDETGTIDTLIVGGSHEYLCKQFERLGNKHNDQTHDFPSVCLKYDVDGLVYKFQHPRKNLDPKSDQIACLRATHVSTFDAFAFVQASKREKRHMFHDPSNRFVIILEGNRRCYIYWHTQAQGIRVFDQQSVIDFGDKVRDADVLGVQMMGDDVIMILLSKAIIAINLF